MKEYLITEADVLSAISVLLDPKMRIGTYYHPDVFQSLHNATSEGYQLILQDYKHRNEQILVSYSRTRI